MKRGLFAVPRAQRENINTWVEANIAGAGPGAFSAPLAADGRPPQVWTACNWVMDRADYVRLEAEVLRLGGMVVEILDDNTPPALLSLSLQVVRQFDGNPESDLKAITGIGDRRSADLNALSVWSYRDLIEADTARLAEAMGVLESVIFKWQTEAP